MGAWFREKELPEFIHYLKKDKVLPVKQAATIIGKQPNCASWVLTPDLQVIL